MKIFNIVIIVLKYLLLGAHFLRISWYFLFICSLTFLIFIFIRKPWSARVLQTGLVIGTVEWIRTIFITIQNRIEYDMDWTRMATILSVVALLTAFSAITLQFSSLRKRFNFHD